MIIYTLLLHSILPAVLLQLSTFKIPKQPCPCSQSVYEPLELESVPSNQISSQGSETETVNETVPGPGDETKPPVLGTRPWIAKLLLKNSRNICGAALINKRFLLTSASCVCGVLPCNEDGSPSYSPKSEMLVYLGLNTLEGGLTNSEARGNRSLEYNVETVLSHPQYKSGSDIAVVGMARDAVFQPGHIQPICLPLVDDKSDISWQDIKLTVYAAGWDSLTANNSSSRSSSGIGSGLACSTDDLGPTVDTECQLPFNLYQQKNNLSYSCSPAPTPSSKVSECLEFSVRMKQDYPKTRLQTIVIDTGSTNVTCSVIDPGRFGWCQGAGTKEEDVDNNWGWCRGECSVKQKEEKEPVTKLKEKEFEVLRIGHCKKFLPGMERTRASRLTLCAGKKKKFNKVKYYKKEGESYVLTKVETNYLGLDNAKLGGKSGNEEKGPSGEAGVYPYDYYVHGSDLCHLESGAPLYHWKKNRPTVMAIFSREMKEVGCEGLNRPGIFTRVSKHLEWIYSNSKTGNCDGDQ